MSDDNHSSEMRKLLEEFNAANKRAQGGLIAKIDVNILVMGLICAVAAFIWGTVSPSANLSELQNETTEIKTAVYEMRGTVSKLAEKLDEGQREASQQQSRLSALENQVKTNANDLARINDQLKYQGRRW